MNQQQMQFKKFGLIKKRDSRNILSVFCSTFDFSASYLQRIIRVKNQNLTIL